NKIDRRFIPRWLAILIVYFCLLIGLGLLIYIAYPMIREQVIRFIDQIPLIVNNYQSLINQFDQMIHILPAPIDGGLDELIKKISESSLAWFQNKVLSLGAISEY